MGGALGSRLRGEREKEANIRSGSKDLGRKGWQGDQGHGGDNGGCPSSSFPSSMQRESFCGHYWTRLDNEPS